MNNQKVDGEQGEDHEARPGADRGQLLFQNTNSEGEGSILNGIQ